MSAVTLASGIYDGNALRQLHHQPIPDRHAPVHAGGEVHVVGGDEGGELGGADDGHQSLEDAAGGVGVEVAGGLVGEQQARGIGDGAGDGDALLLAAGEFAGAMIEALAEA